MSSGDHMKCHEGNECLECTPKPWQNLDEQCFREVLLKFSQAGKSSGDLVGMQIPIWSEVCISEGLPGVPMLLV